MTKRSTTLSTMMFPISQGECVPTLWQAGLSDHSGGAKLDTIEGDRLGRGSWPVAGRRLVLGFRAV